MKQFTLPKSERLYLRESIGELFANGKSFSVFPYRVVYLVSPSLPAEGDTSAEGEAQPVIRPSQHEGDPRQGRCAIMAVAPKKRFKHAVDRNHVKRLTREAYRLQKLPLIEALEQRQLRLEVAFIYTDNKFISFDETHRLIGRAIQRIIKAL